MRKTSKWKYKYYKVKVYDIYKKLFDLGIDPEIILELQLDKELSLTLSNLEMETSLLYVKFMKELTHMQK